MTGKTVLHYEISEQIGSGGMGAVYRARDTRLGREVALKFINPQYQQDPDHRARLLREARAAASPGWGQTPHPARAPNGSPERLRERPVSRCLVMAQLAQEPGAGCFARSPLAWYL